MMPACLASPYFFRRMVRGMSNNSASPRLRIGIDTGGTFTDIVSVDTVSGATLVTKVASTPANPAIGLERGVNQILAASGAATDAVAGLAHGTTVARNALLQGELNSLGLIVNSGFKHSLEIARQSVPEGYGNSYFWVKPDRIVPLQFVREVVGRLDFRGNELRPLEEATVSEAWSYFRAQGIRAIGICLLHSYANDAHERRAAEIVTEEYPDATLSLSCVGLPEYREYERAVTTLVDAFVKPHMERYLKRVHQELGAGPQDKPFLVMQSSGGVAPGPRWYPNGGSEPTITDANLVLGRIPPSLIGGGIALGVDRARGGIAALAAKLSGGMNVEQLASGIIEIANWSQANAIRQMTIQRGIDPRAFALLSFGGAGPAQSAAVMDLLAMKACIVPPNPGNLSAFGLLAVDWRTDHIVTKVMHEDVIDLAEVAARYGALERDATATLMRDGIEASRIRLVRDVDIRYAGQSMEVRVTAPGGAVDASFLAGLVRAFTSAPSPTFGYNYAGKQKIELVNLCVSGFGVIERPQLPKLALRSADFGPKSTRPVYFGAEFRDTPVFDRASLPPGGRVDGPAVFEEFGSTTVVFTGH